MKAYIGTTGTIFGLLTVAHVWRMAAEGTHVANPVFLLTTLLSAALCVWAWRVFRVSMRYEQSRPR
jgi:hypothetical protein